LTVTLNPQPSFGGHSFPDFMGPVYFEGDLGGGGGGVESAPAPVVDAPVVDTPVVDTAPVTEPVTPAEPAPTGDAPVVDTPVSDAPVVVDPADDSIPEALRPYVKQLREEAAERRVALKPFEEAFSNYEPEQAQALLGVVAALSDPESQLDAATQLKELAEAILGDIDLNDPNRPLTRADLERIEADKQAKAQEEAAVQAVIAEATELGFPEGEGEAGRGYRRLMDLAVSETKGDLKAAAAIIQAERDAIIADYAKQVMEGKAKWPTLPPPVGDAPADITGAPPKTFAEARANAKARAEAAYRALPQ
jgi:hypothetical protein